MTIAQNSEMPCLAPGDRGLLRGRIKLLFLVGGIVLLGLILPFPVDGRLWSRIFDLAHAPVFFFVVLAVAGFIDPGSIGLSQQFGRLCAVRTGETMLISGGCFLVGCLGEFLQAFSGRSPSAGDLIANGAGIASGVMWLRSRQATGKRRVLYVVVVFAVLACAMIGPALGIWGAIQQQVDFPMLASFERSSDLGAWSGHHAKIRRTAEWATAGQYSLQVDFSPGRFSGANLVWPVRDWSGHDRLRWDIHNPSATPISATVKIYDVPHTFQGYERADRFQTTVEIPPASMHEFSIELTDVAAAPETRAMDMKQITAVELFVEDLPAARILHLDNMRLVRDSDNAVSD
jgi:hypothetical protein